MLEIGTQQREMERKKEREKALFIRPLGHVPSSIKNRGIHENNVSYTIQ